MVRSGCVKCSVCLFGVAFLVALILVAVSFSVVEPTEAGIEYSSANVQIKRDRVYTAGRYYLGVGRSFFLFPVTEQNVEFSDDSGADGAPLEARSSGGRVQIECSFQYRLMLPHLIDVYDKYQLQYHNRFVNIAKSALQNVAASFPLEAFYEQRRAVSTAMFNTVRNLLLRDFADVTAFQLRQIQLPVTTDAVVVDKLVTQEQERTAENRRVSRTILSEASVVVGAARADVTKLQAERNAQAVLLVRSAQANATAVSLAAQQSAYETLKAQLGFNTTELLRYVHLRALREAPRGVKLAVGFDKPILSL